jgi:streptogramin lyase
MDEPPAWPKRKLWILAIVFVAIAAVIAITAVALGALYKGRLRPNREREFALPFTGLHDPRGVAVDAAGNVYVADSGNNRVLKPAAGSSTQTVLPSTGGATPDAVAVDSAGAVYASVFKGSGRTTLNYLLRLGAGSDTWTTLASAGAEQYAAVDTAGNVYVVTSGDVGGVMRLTPGSSSWRRLPGAYDFRAAGGLAVDAPGNAYVTDNLTPGQGVHSQGLVVKLPAS